jgi:hypothetical protein
MRHDELDIGKESPLEIGVAAVIPVGTEDLHGLAGNQGSEIRIRNQN